MATQFAVDLVFKSQTQQLDQVTGKIGRMERELAKLKGQNPLEAAESGARNAGQAIDNTARRAKSASSAFGELAGAVGKLAAIYGTLRGAQAAISVGIDRAESTRRLAALAKGFNEVGLAQGAAARAAQKFGLSQTEATQQFAQIYARLRPVGVQLQDIETAFNGFNTAAKLSGTSASEASSAWLQLGQALGSGVLRGEELNSVFEQTPAIVQAIAKEMNVPIGQIRQYAQDGKITSDIVIRALKRIETEGVAGLESAMNSPTQKLKEFQNQWENLQVALTTGVLPAITKVIGDLATKIQGLTGEVERTGKAFDIIAQSPVVQFFTSLAGGIADAARELDRFVGTAEFFQRNPSASFGPVWAGIAGLREKFLGANGVGTSASGANGMGGRYVPGDQQQLWTTPTPPPRTPAAAATGSSSTQRRLQGLQGRYIQGGYGPGGANAYGAHFDIKRVDGSYFNRSELDRYVSVNGRALSSGVTVPGGQFGASRDGGRRTHNAWDYAFGNGAALTLKGGAKWQSTSGSSYGDVAVFQTPDGKTYRIIHGKFEKTGGQADTIADQLQAELDRQETLQKSYETGQRLTTQYQQQLEIELAADQNARKRLEIQYQFQDRQEEINKLLDGSQKAELTALNEKIKAAELLQLQTDELKEQLRLYYELADASALLGKTYGRGGKAENFRTDIDLDPGKKQGKLKGYMDNLRAELADTEGMILSLAGTIESEIGSAMSSAITGVIQGTMTVEEAMSRMFSNIGAAFIEMATQMIAKALIMKVLGIFTGGIGGGGGLFSGAGPVSFPSSGSFNGFAPGMPSFFAEGGFVTGPTRAILGEGGEPEVVLPQSKIGAAMSNYRPGSGAAGLAQAMNAPEGAGGGGSIDISYSVTEINSMRFVTEDQFQEGMAVAAKRGASGGHAQVMGDLRNKRSVRSRMGMA